MEWAGTSSTSSLRQIGAHFTHPAVPGADLEVRMWKGERGHYAFEVWQSGKKVVSNGWAQIARSHL
jgi:hypothetical protein